ncbi:MAG TPA: ABC transporter permease [Candidatus Sulfotelmatobacter sp.]|nr:ABC transporter permease [Candidatus Sulfotelmatobacter sp.]
MTSLARAAFGALRVSMRLRVVSPFAYLNWLVFPLIFACVGLYVLKQPGAAGSHMAYGVLGGGLIGYWSVAYLDGGNSIQDERWNGTLEQIFAVPAPLWVIVLGKAVGSILFGLVAFLPTAALAYFGFHAALPGMDATRFTISLAMLSFTFLAIAITLTPLFALVRWAFNLINGFEMGVYVLCGFMFPVSVLVPWAQGIGALLAPTWATRALYASTTTDGPHDYALWWLASVALSVAYLVGAYFLYRLVQFRARVSGDLALA